MKVINKFAYSNYNILETMEVGISLTGAEVKGAQKGDVDLSRAHVRIIKNEAYLLNAGIAVHADSTADSRRSRKLLLHRAEIVSISTKIAQKNLTIVPVSMYNKHRIFKLQIGLARTKREFEKREQIKKRDLSREAY